MTDVKLDHPGGQLTMPVRAAVEGPSGIDVNSLLKETGYVTVDNGFMNTASCSSTITYIDGDAGILRSASLSDAPSGSAEAFLQERRSPAR
jgi:citrate synthase